MHVWKLHVTCHMSRGGLEGLRWRLTGDWCIRQATSFIPGRWVCEGWASLFLSPGHPFPRTHRITGHYMGFKATSSKPWKGVMNRWCWPAKVTWAVRGTPSETAVRTSRLWPGFLGAPSTFLLPKWLFSSGDLEESHQNKRLCGSLGLLLTPVTLSLRVELRPTETFHSPGSWKSISRFFSFREEVRSLDNGVLILTSSKNGLGKTSKIRVGFLTKWPAWRARVGSLVQPAEHKHFCAWKNF